jgi:hypothetical protein
MNHFSRRNEGGKHVNVFFDLGTDGFVLCTSWFENTVFGFEKHVAAFYPVYRTF